MTPTPPEEKELVAYITMLEKVCISCKLPSEGDYCEDCYFQFAGYADVA